MKQRRKTLKEAREERQPTAGLYCPRCACRRFEVERTTRLADSVRRVRICLHCGHRFVTVEKAR